MLTIENIRSGYVKNVDILKDVSFMVKEGKFHCILGANGCGKSTLLKTVLALLPASSGKVTFEGEDVLSLNEKKRAKILAYIPQVHKTPFPFTVEDVVRMGRTPYLSYLSKETKEDREISNECMKKLGIYSLKNTPYTRLSGGQQQLVVIARALAQEAKFLIMDEPTSSLDFGNQYKVLNQIKVLSNEGLGVLMVTHDPAHCFHVADHVIMMKQGQVLRQGVPEEVMTEEILEDLYDLPLHITEVELDKEMTKFCIPKRNSYRRRSKSEKK